MKMINLEKCFKAAIEKKQRYVGVKIKMDGFKNSEIIINENVNFNKKLDYYKRAYNDNLTLKNAPDKIKIIGFTFGNSFEAIEKQLIF